MTKIVGCALSGYKACLRVLVTWCRDLPCIWFVWILVCLHFAVLRLLLNLIGTSQPVTLFCVCATLLFISFPEALPLCSKIELCHVHVLCSKVVFKGKTVLKTLFVVALFHWVFILKSYFLSSFFPQWMMCVTVWKATQVLNNILNGHLSLRIYTRVRKLSISALVTFLSRTSLQL